MAKSATEIRASGVPAISSDGARVAVLDVRAGYDDSAIETLLIIKVAGEQLEQSLTLRKAGAGGQKATPWKRVREAVQDVNQRLKDFRGLADYQRVKKSSEGDSSSGEKPSPYYRLKQGSRQLVYSLRSGHLELTDGKTALLSETIQSQRAWYCCHQASQAEGGCKRPPERVTSASGDDQVLIVELGFSSGPDGCELERDRRIFRLKPQNDKAPAP